MSDPQANIGVVGLAVMGSNLARNLASRAGNTVAVYNRSPERTDALLAEHGDAGFIAAETIGDFAASLTKPRTAIIMVQAGAGPDAVIEQLSAAFEAGDIIVDGGNSLFTDTIRLEREARARGPEFVGTGISGGEEGAWHGPSIMPGGSVEAYATAGPILESIAAVFDEWNRGPRESYLEITAEVLRQVDAPTGRPLVDVIVDEAGAKGTGVWTVQNALGLVVPVGGIAEAVFARAVSSKTDQRAAVRATIAARPQIQTAGATFQEDVRRGDVGRAPAGVRFGARVLDSLASERLPAALIQAQRDYFGAHTYHRIDRPRTFHTFWSQDGSDHAVEASSH